MIYAADLDQDGKVSKDEFMMVMRKMKLIWIDWYNELRITYSLKNSFTQQFRALIGSCKVTGWDTVVFW